MIQRTRKYKREFRAAVITFLGEATYLGLSAHERERVDAEVSRMLAASFTPATAMHFFTEHWEAKAQTRARAMRRLGVKPIGSGLTWKEFLPLMLIFPEPSLFYQFRASSGATADAEQYLIDRGVPVPAQHGR